jgi:hypothetical protein
MEKCKLAIVTIATSMVVIVSALLTFTRFADDHHSSSVRTPATIHDVVSMIAKIRTDLDNPRAFNVRNATDYIRVIADQAYSLTAADFLPRNEQESNAFEKQFNSILTQIFEIRQMLRERQRQFENEGVWSSNQSADAIAAFRLAHLYLRYAEDFAIEWYDGRHPLHRSAVFFDGEGPLSLHSPKASFVKGKLEFQAGDVILVRGASFASASIARISDVPTSMSHLAMVAIDPNGRLMVVESLLEKGVTYYPVEEYLKLEPLPRAAVFRFFDATIAYRAAQESWKLAMENKAKRIPFDLEMDSEEHSKIYCAEAVGVAYERATKGTFKFPLHQTSFEKARQTDFFKGIGIAHPNAFAPSDLDVDTRFDLIAEHRDLDLLAKSRMYDAILSMLFSKFEQGFTYKPSLSVFAQATFGKIGRELGFFSDQISADVSWTALFTLLQQKKTVESVLTDLQAASSEESSRLHRPLAYRELLELLDKICHEDCVQKKSDEAYDAPSAVHD